MASVTLPDDRLLLLSQSGQVLAVAADLRRSTLLKTGASADVLGAVAVGPKSIALARVNGVGTLALEP